MSLRQKTIHGLLWSGCSQFGKQASQLLITAILAHLLSPKDFGLIGMATVFTGFATVFSELGVSSALIQKQNIDDRHLSSAFWLNVIVGAALTILFIFLSTYIASFYKRPELKMVIVVMSFNFLLSAFTVVQQTIFTKNLDFKILTLRDLSAVAISGCISICFALKGAGVWSLVIQLISCTVINNIFLWICSRWRPSFLFSKDAIKEIFAFSAHMTGFQTVNYLARNIDYLLIGRFLGADALGFYTLGYKILLYPIQNVTQVINRVIFPVFSRIQDDPAKISRIYLKIVEIVAVIVFPMMAIFFVIAPEFVLIFFGPKWISAVALIQIMCFCGMIQSISGPIVGNIRLSLGKTDLHFKIGLINALLVATAVIIGLKWGILGVTISYTVFSFFWALYTNAITLPLISVSLNNYFGVLKLPCLAVVFFMLFNFVKQLFMFSTFVNMVLLVFIGLSVYAGFLFKFHYVIIKKRTISLNYEF